MNKPVTRLFTRSALENWFGATGDKAPDWVGGRETMELCRDALRQLWDFPKDTKRIWLTASTVPTPGESYRLKRAGVGWLDNGPSYESGRFSFDSSAQRYLGRRFDTKYVYITMEYE